MANMLITEGQVGSSGGFQTMRHPVLGRQVVAITGSSVPSAPFSGDTKQLRLFSEARCYFVVGLNPDATGPVGEPMGVEQTEYIEVQAGHRLAVIARP